jgi:DNA invertase Pin-like site-specific DNA recombinase
MRAAIYARVSTDKQELKQQVDTDVKFCEMKGWEYEVFVEQKSSTKERPVLREVLRQCTQKKFDVVVVFRIDRGWRSSRQFIMDFDSLANFGIYIISVMEGLDPTTPMGKAMMTILVALAELERVNISIATKQRLGALKRLGKTLGRPKGSKDKPGHVRPKSGYYLREANKRGVRKPVNGNLEDLDVGK